MRSASLALLATLSACDMAPRLPAPTEPGTTYHGSDFTLREPHRAPSDSVEASFPVFAGTRFRLYAPPESLAIAEAVVSRLEMGLRLSAEEWIDSVWQAATVPEGDLDAWSNWEKPRRLTGLDGRAWELNPHCGDCESRQVFIVDRRRVAVLTLMLDARSFEEREPARVEFHRMVTSFRWVR